MNLDDETRRLNREEELELKVSALEQENSELLSTQSDLSLRSKTKIILLENITSNKRIRTLESQLEALQAELDMKSSSPTTTKHQNSGQVLEFTKRVLLPYS